MERQFHGIKNGSFIMSAKRLISDEQRQTLRDSKKHKGKDLSKLTRQDLDDLIIILAKKANIL